MGLAETLNRAPFSLCFPDLCNPSHELRSVFSHPFPECRCLVSKPWPLVPFPCIHRRSLAVPLHKGRTSTLLHLLMGRYAWTVFSACSFGLGHHRFWGLHRCRAQRRPGRLFGLTILKIGLAGLFVMLLFVDRFPHNEIILWLLLMLMAGALISHMLFVVRRPRSFFFLSGRRGGRASAIGRISRFSPMALGKFSFRYASESPAPSFGIRKSCGQGFNGAKV